MDRPAVTTIPTMSPTWAATRPHYGHGESTTISIILVIVFTVLALFFLVLYNFWMFLPEDSCIRRAFVNIGPPPHRSQRYRDVRNPSPTDDETTEVELSNLNDEPETLCETDTVEETPK